jgi:G:T/U-mismatch repair DNA glycosylase
MPGKYYNKPTKPDVYEVEEHPYKQFIPPNPTHLLVGTFPTHITNSKYKFFYSAKENGFWDIMADIFDTKFRFHEGEVAVKERSDLLTKIGIAMTDMHLKCYRRNDLSTDENLFPICLTDILSILDGQKSIKTLVFTSRTEIFGAWGLFKTHLIQKDKAPPELHKRPDKVLEGELEINGSKFKIYVPYSTSPRLIKDGKVTKQELIAMYKFCLGK